jgi:LacI family gluconate utilization system Gnt-I transcriptional repressor
MNFSDGPERHRPVRVEDVARVAGVSPITVSRALSNPEKVKHETRERVRLAVEQTGYVVNTFASNLRSGRSSIVSVFVSNLQNAHIVQAMKGCTDALADSGFHTFIAQTDYSTHAEEGLLASVMPLRPAAIVFTGLVQSERVREALTSFGAPVMEMWDYVEDPLDMLVGFSNSEGGHLMGEHFGQRGFKHIAYVGRVSDRGAERLSGFKQGLAKYGVDVGLVLPLHGPPTIHDGRSALESVLDRFPQCDAIFFSSDILAIGALLHLARRSKRGRRNIAIAGYGDMTISAELPTPLTTVHLDAYAMGYKAGQMILMRLRGKALDEKLIRSSMHLEIRESTLLSHP